MTNKCCLVYFRSKKINIAEKISETLEKFASNGVYFDRTELCAYDDHEEITRSVTELKGRYKNIVLISPKSMYETLKNFIEQVFEAKFDIIGSLKYPAGNIFLLPGDCECKLTLNDIAAIINKDVGITYSRSYIKTVGASINLINSAIAEGKELCPDCEFNVRDKFSDCSVEIVYPDSVPKSQYDNMLRVMLLRLSDYVYALEDVTLAEQLYHLLHLRRMKISVAESFTGGGICKRLVEVSGISEVYQEGLNTYSNLSKQKRLGVEEITLRQYGAVSEQTAYEMVSGLLKTGDCDVAVATTGIAGPKSDSTLKPVGLLYIAVGTKDDIEVFKYNLSGSREKITETAINLALFHVFKTVK